MRPAKPLSTQFPFILVFLGDVIIFVESLESHIASVIIREMQVKTTVRYYQYLTPVRMAIIKKVYK